MEVTTLGALVGLFIAIILIIKKFVPVYSLMIGAFLAGIIGGASIIDTVNMMSEGSMSMAPSIIRALASGILAGSLIKTGSVDKISEWIIELLGEKRAILGIAISSMVLAGVGVNLDVAIITVAPIAIYIGNKLSYSRMAILLAMAGGGKAGNIISPNPNTIAVSDNFNITLSQAMISNILPAVVGLIVTVILSNMIINKGSYIDKDEVIVREEETPSLFKAVIGPIVALGLLFMGNVSTVVIDPLVALPVGGFVTLVATGNIKNANEYISFGLSKMQGVCILLLGIGTMAGIIENSGIQQATMEILSIFSLPSFLLAPISGMLMSLATGSSTAGASIASSAFSETIIDGGVSSIGGAAMINAGASTFEQLPNGSLFHSSAGCTHMKIGERFKLLPYEIIIGVTMTVVSSIIYGII